MPVTFFQSINYLLSRWGITQKKKSFKIICKSQDFSNIKKKKIIIGCTTTKIEETALVKKYTYAVWVFFFLNPLFNEQNFSGQFKLVLSWKSSSTLSIQFCLAAALHWKSGGISQTLHICLGCNCNCYIGRDPLVFPINFN